jgi:hypothetical protein
VPPVLSVPEAGPSPALRTSPERSPVGVRFWPIPLKNSVEGCRLRSPQRRIELRREVLARISASPLHAVAGLGAC